jgi:hypothetical protein
MRRSAPRSSGRSSATRTWFSSGKDPRVSRDKGKRCDQLRERSSRPARSETPRSPMRPKHTVSFRHGQGYRYTVAARAHYSGQQPGAQSFADSPDELRVRHQAHGVVMGSVASHKLVGNPALLPTCIHIHSSSPFSSPDQTTSMK